VTDFEHPEDDPREDEEPAAPEEPVAEEPVASEEPAAEEPAASEEPVAEEPVASERPVAEEPVASEQPVAEEPVASEQPVAEEPAAPEEPVAEEPAASEEPAAEHPAEPVAEAEEPPPAAEEVGIVAVEDATGEELVEVEEDETEVAPRQKPEIPGADLIPDIIPEGEEFLDAEAQAAAEAEAEAAAAQAAEGDEMEAQPIADAAIDLAAGARYTSTGKRKTAVARVVLKPGSGTYAINGKPLETFFPRETLQRMIRQPLETVGYESRMDVVARMHGGGVAAQAGALRHGISRALIVADPHLRGELKRRGFLTRDPRVKERKKAGLKKARKRPQFSKR
jgi:small subunit ribosomal protein S9